MTVDTRSPDAQLNPRQKKASRDGGSRNLRRASSSSHTTSRASIGGYEGRGAGHGRAGAGHHVLEVLPGPIDEIAHKHGRLPFRQRVLRVTWGWFPCTMSTGALASLLSQQPFTFTGLETIGKVVYILDVVLFTIFTFLMVCRFSLKPRALTTSLHHPSESFFFGAFWVSVALVLYGMQVYGVPAVGGKGSWLAKALRVLFWMYMGCASLTAVFQYHVIFHVEKLMISDAMPAWILPAYPFLVTGVLAAAIAKTQPEQSAKQMIVAGIAGQGLGWMLALFIYMVFLTRLINSNMPPASTRPGMYVSVGPAAYTCAGLISLGKRGKSVLPDNFLGEMAIPIGDLWYGMAVAAAIFLWLLAAWFSMLSTASIILGSKQMGFSLQWWAFVFPNAGLAIATIQIGNVLDSDGIRGVGTGITIILIPLWIMCAVLHVRALWRHDILAPGKDEGVDDVNNKHDIKRQEEINEKQGVVV
ncbi:hypothetical protein MKZ38_009988 [Zalerion maritima]|uniref:Malic acid transport protein n=1 Tax=Zalerion maritima TaxID=339359 RepID=A0AAD5RSS9_9PEZI|nr:hypothetical protein MKZ38_009988 [Zalerion maritima]